MKKQAKKRVKQVKWSDGYEKHTETGTQISFNNSGGYWWLSLEDEEGMKREGFRLDIHDFLGRHVKYAFLPKANIKECLAAFRRATQYTGTELGCSCCGVPFSFHYYVKGEDKEYYSPEHQTHGNDYKG